MRPEKKRPSFDINSIVTDIFYFLINCSLNLFLIIIIVVAAAINGYFLFDGVLPTTNPSSKIDLSYLVPTLVADNKLTDAQNTSSITCPDTSAVKNQLFNNNFDAWENQGYMWRITPPISFLASYDNYFYKNGRLVEKGNPSSKWQLNGTIITSLSVLDNKLSCQYSTVWFLERYNSVEVRLLPKYNENSSMQKGLWLSFEDIYKCPNYKEPCLFSIKKAAEDAKTQ